MEYRKKNVLVLVILLLLMVGIIVYLYINRGELSRSFQPGPDIFPTSTLPEAEDIESESESDAIQYEYISPAMEWDEEDGLPHDKLFITVERQNYSSGDLTLIIPSLDFKEDIEDSTKAVALNRGPGLYEYAQLPGTGNRNVSIAAHRNTSRGGVIGEWFFYYIDTLTTGDYLYLVNSEFIYQYEYDQTTVVDAYDWGPIYSQGFSCLTLTSCEPIGVSTHRIIVRSKLVDIIPYSSDYVYE